MRVASYNIRKAVGLDWRRDPGRIIDVLAEINADIVVLQEADKRIGARAGVLPLDRLNAKLGLTPAALSLRPRSHGWHGNAVLLKSTFSDHTASRIELPTTEPRGAVSVLLHKPQIEIIGAHLGLTPRARGRQLQVLKNLQLSRNHPVLLAGDFNERDANRLGFAASCAVVSPGPSFHAARPKSALDRFVLSPGLRAVSSHVHLSPLSKRASDHLPIVIDLAFTEPP